VTPPPTHSPSESDFRGYDRKVTQRPEEEDIGRASRRLTVAVLEVGTAVALSDSLKLILTAGVVNVIAHLFFSTDDPLFVALKALVGLIDLLAAILIVKDMVRAFVS